MQPRSELIKQELANQISKTDNPVVKRLLEKRLKEIDKDIRK